MAGQKIGLPEEGASAYQYKELHPTLTDFSDDELRQIRVVPTGARLKQGATFLGLRSPERREFVATADMSAASDDRLVSKSEVAYPCRTGCGVSKIRSGPPEVRAVP